MNKLNRIFLLSSYLIVTVCSVQAQHSSESLRDASPHGPYPIYLDLSYSSSSNVEDFAKLSNALNDSKVAIRGFEVNAGVALHEDSWFFKNLYFEGGYKLLTRRPAENVDTQLHLFTFGIGRRYTIFYPLTLQVRVGPILKITRVFDFEGTNMNRRVKTIVPINSFRKNKPVFPGWQGKIKLLVLDPIGTSGGIGFFLQWQFFYIFEAHGRNYNTFIDSSILPDNNIQTDNYFSSFSVGIVVPLSIRVK